MKEAFEFIYHYNSPEVNQWKQIEKNNAEKV